MKNMHDDTLELLIEGEHDVNIVEDDFDIKKAVCMFVVCWKISWKMLLRNLSKV